MQLNHFTPFGVVTWKGNFEERIETGCNELLRD
jgi:hypothetical protein